MTNAPATARVRVAVPGDDATLERAAQQLRAELLDLEVESVHRATVGDAPPGAKAVEAIELGTFVVTLVTSGALLEQVVGLLRSEGFLAVASMGSGDDDGDEGAVWTSSDGERWERQDTTVFRGAARFGGR